MSVFDPYALLCFEMTDVNLVCVKGCKSLCV